VRGRWSPVVRSKTRRLCEELVGLSQMRSRSLVPLFLVSGTMTLGYGSIYALLADLRDRFGFTGTQLGLIVAAGFLAGFCAQLFLARYADRGAATLMVRGGIVVGAMAMVGSAVATQFLGIRARAAAARHPRPVLVAGRCAPDRPRAHHAP
jgi:MFS family permease